MPNWKLTIEYTGTRYRGWQEQKNARSVQGEIRRAAEDLFGAQVELVGAGRTDAGVHALGQVAHLRSSRRVDVQSILHGLNDRLPHDVHVRGAEEVDGRFHARHDAEERFYLYQISRVRTAFAKSFVWWVRSPLDAEAMGRVCGLFTGRRDFAAFCDRPGEASSTLVEVTHSSLVEWGDLILFRIGASHFLWKMVRRIVGVMVEAGRGNVSTEQVEGFLRGRGPSVARWTAPPSGLFLESVRYPGDAPIGPLVPAFFTREDRLQIPDQSAKR